MAITEETVIKRELKEWQTRPDDERYLTLDHLYHNTRARADFSEERVIPNKSLVAKGDGMEYGNLCLEHEELGSLTLTHWSLGQLATIAHTPVKWIRDIAPFRTGTGIAAHAINLGLRHLAHRADVQVMTLPTSPGLPTGKLRCIVGPTYGRIHDYEVVDAVRQVNADGRWKVPAEAHGAQNSKRATTLYASDRDVFIFLVDEDHPVQVTVAGVQRYLFRGFMVWNSEVGHHKFGLMTFLYDFYCDNRMVLGAREVKEIEIKHTKNAPLRFAREALPVLRRFTDSSPRGIEQQLARAAEMRIGTSDEEVMAWLRDHEFTKPESEKMIQAAKAEEGGARTLWEIVNGGTAVARAIPHTDSRVALERRASRLLKLAA